MMVEVKQYSKYVSVLWRHFKDFLFSLRKSTRLQVYIEVCHLGRGQIALSQGCISMVCMPISLMSTCWAVVLSFLWRSCKTQIRSYDLCGMTKMDIWYLGERMFKWHWWYIVLLFVFACFWQKMIVKLLLLLFLNEQIGDRITCHLNAERHDGQVSLLLSCVPLLMGLSWISFGNGI